MTDVIHFLKLCKFTNIFPSCLISKFFKTIKTKFLLTFWLNFESMDSGSLCSHGVRRCGTAPEQLEKVQWELVEAVVRSRAKMRTPTWWIQLSERIFLSLHLKHKAVEQTRHKLLSLGTHFNKNSVFNMFL